MEQSKAMEYGSRKASPDILKYLLNRTILPDVTHAFIAVNFRVQDEKENVFWPHTIYKQEKNSAVKLTYS
jgi:hypothetical protein